jgi:hypothetical protein
MKAALKNLTILILFVLQSCVPGWANQINLYYPSKVESIRDSVVLSVYLRIIALANDELRIKKATYALSDAKLVQRKVNEIIKPLSTAKQMTFLTTILRERELEGSAAEYERAMIVLRCAEAAAMTKLVALGTHQSKAEFLRFKSEQKAGDSGYFPIFLEELERKLNANLKSQNN